MFTSALNERSRSNPLCDFRLGTVVTSDYETPLTKIGLFATTVSLEIDREELDHVNVPNRAGGVKRSARRTGELTSSRVHEDH